MVNALIVAATTVAGAVLGGGVAVEILYARAGDWMDTPGAMLLGAAAGGLTGAVAGTVVTHRRRRS